MILKLLLPFLVSFSVPTNHEILEKDIQVYVFMGEECVITQYYTPLLRELHQTYQSERIEFVGIFPNPSSSSSKISAFKEKYKVPFELKLDPFQKIKDKFDIKITPEVVVWQNSTGTILYQGRINNAFFRVGKRRTVVTTSELKDVLNAIVKNEVIPHLKTVSVGCIITELEERMKNVPMCATPSDTTSLVKEKQ